METLSCLYLDAFISGYRIDGRPSKEIDKIFVDSPEKTVQVILTPAQRDRIYQELSALRNLIGFKLSVKKRLIKGTDEYQYGHKLDPTSPMFVCWYTHLRQLIDNNPSLAPLLRIAPLPGRGFKGDWKLGLVRGSVSTHLGVNVIKMLCNRKEDFKRYVRGVGLPASSKIFESEDFSAWPSCSKMMTLKTIMEIHKNAHERSKIPKYLAFRTMLATLGEQLVYYDNEELKENKEAFKNKFISRVINIIKTLTADWEIESIS
jgi:hypothetical protein